jgi:GNAT superfamily N-acetyltransferase
MNREKDITREERELLTNLRGRPGMYLGSESLYALHLFLEGYRIAAMRHDLHDVQIIPEEFQAFVEDYYFVRRGTPMSWCTLIMQHQPDERKALDVFWELLNEYLVSVDCEEISAPTDKRIVTVPEDGIQIVYPPHIQMLAESYMRTFNGEPWWDRWDRKTAVERLQDIRKTPGFCGYALWQDGTPLGAVLGRSEHYFDGDCFQIVELWIEPRAQKQGWGKKLLDALIGHLREHHVRRLYLITMRGEATEGFYRKCGFATQEGMCIMQLS